MLNGSGRVVYTLPSIVPSEMLTHLSGIQKPADTGGKSAGWLSTLSLSEYNKLPAYIKNKLTVNMLVEVIDKMNGLITLKQHGGNNTYM